MRILNTVTFLVTISMLSGCYSWSRWMPEQPDDNAYKGAGYGHEKSIYSEENLDLLRLSLERKNFDHKPIDIEELKKVKNKAVFSATVAKTRRVDKVKDYLKQYKDMLFSEPSPYYVKVEGAPNNPFFELDEYYLIIPKGNIKSVQDLSMQNITPMPPDMAKDVYNYYDAVMEAESHVDQEKYDFIDRYNAVDNTIDEKDYIVKLAKNAVKDNMSKNSLYNEAQTSVRREIMLSDIMYNNDY